MVSAARDDQSLKVREDEMLGAEDKCLPSRSPTPQRQSNKPSPDRSEYEEVLNAASAKSAEMLHCYYSTSGYNVRIKDDGGVCLYYVENSQFTPKKADITLRKGSDRDAQIVGVVKWSTLWSKKAVIGLGDPQTNESSVIWTELKCDDRWHTNHKWRLELADGSSRTFAWKRAKLTDPNSNFWDNKNFKLEDEATGEMVAFFGSKRWKSLKKLGKFHIWTDYGERWKLMVLLTGLSLVERSRRRSRRRKHD